MHVSIRMKGHLDSSWQEWLERLQILHEPDGNTMLIGQLKDQPALYGILIKLNQLGLSLLCLQSYEPMANDPSPKKGNKSMAQHNDSQTLASASTTPTGVATGRVAGATGPGLEQQRLQVFIGKWINQGQTVASAEVPEAKILVSDVYEWVPGGFFVLHTAYGRIGSVDVGGIEIIGYDAQSKCYRTHFFDSQGNISSHTLTERDGGWMWQGEHTRCTAVLSDDGKTQVAHHERTDDGTNWVPSMEVTLTRVD